jgi:hypothetical protein
MFWFSKIISTINKQQKIIADSLNHREIRIEALEKLALV